MIAPRRAGAILAIAGVAALLGACTTSYPTREVSDKFVEMERPESPLKDAELLGVRIAAFDPGKLPEDENVAKGISQEIRDAEAYFIAVQLKNTMQRSGYWGPVRVVPKGTQGGEVFVNGRILESDGEILKIEISVNDATGTHWFTKEYERVVDDNVYARAQQQGVDAFQTLYNQVANDIAAHRETLSEKDSLAIRQVAELRFGAEFAPQVFGSYLQRGPAEPMRQDNGLQKLVAFFTQPSADDSSKAEYTVLRLPSEQDPLVQRVSRLRAREEFLIDVLDQQYDGLARSLGGPYTQWRESRLREIKAIRESDRLKSEEQSKAVAIGILGVLAGAALGSQKNCYGCQTTGVAIATAATMIAVQKATQASQQAAAEADLRKTALEELGRSLAADVKPVVIDVEGQTVELKGTVEKKFEQWREILHKLHEQEVGPTPPPSAPQIS